MPQLSKPQQFAGLLVWLVVTFAAAWVGAIASMDAGTFYSLLSRPPWAPPSSLFAPVWTVLYALMAIAAWLVWRQQGFKANRGALLLFLVQLAANSLWTWLFFAWHQGALAFAEILLLWVLIVATVVLFWRRHALAGALLLPYLAWVSFASALTLSVWRLNPGVL